MTPTRLITNKKQQPPDVSGADPGRDTFRGPGAGTARIGSGLVRQRGSAPRPTSLHPGSCAVSGWQAASDGRGPGAKSVTRKGGGAPQALIDGPGAWPRRGYGSKCR
ncbi:unnamed protein product [Rangifer tarandus platyrhynchus]|uniref:Uncharacterized protein n=1 Tax=Rangifer tarandus platyrhynchus TaxID=3082113 RepID=A0AC59Y143_RANTA